MTDRLYELLPAIYRIHDAERGEVLRALLGILEEELERLEDDVDGLYEDLFVETAAEWVVPYIGDLLGVRGLHDVPSGGIFSQRALVANTLRYRRRKGTLLMLEDLARDVTGWACHAVAFFELLGWSQNLNHLRPSVGTVRLRDLDVADRIGGAFDVCSHTVDVRRPVGREGWYNIRNLGFYLWRLRSYPLKRVRPARSGDFADGFHFSPLGNPAPLFTNEARKPDDFAHSTEANVPGPIRPIAFFRNPGAFYGGGPDHSVAIWRGEQLIPPEQVICKELSAWSPPPSGMVAVDVALGRLAFAPGETPAEAVTVDYHYGFSADIGGGPYDRRRSLSTATSDDDFAITIAKVQPDGIPVSLWRDTLAGAIAAWDPVTQPRAVLTVADSATYDELLDLELGSGQQLVVQAGNRQRPTVRVDLLTLGGGAGAESALRLDGLLIEGGIRIEAGSLGRLQIHHCTLVPGRALDEAGLPVQPGAASLEIDDDNPLLEVVIEASVTGAIRGPAVMGGLSARDSVIDAADPDGPREALVGPPSTLERVTVFGSVTVEMIPLASEVLFTGPVQVRRKQVGCIRFSYVDDLVSVTPRRFRCQPDLALERASTPAEAAQIRSRMRPDFTVTRYGLPAYAQLGGQTDDAIRAGAEDGSEMGAFERLKQPQREANLKMRLGEYMPYGLEAGLLFVT